MSEAEAILWQGTSNCCDEVHRRLVPAGDEPGDALGAAVGVDLEVFVEAELQPVLHSALVVPKGLSRGRASSSGV